GAEQPRGAGAGRLGGVRHEGLALQLGAQRPDGPAASLGVEADAPPQPVRQAGHLAVAVEDGDVDAGAVVEADGVAAAALVVVVDAAGLYGVEREFAQ